MIFRHGQSVRITMPTGRVREGYVVRLPGDKAPFTDDDGTPTVVPEGHYTVRYEGGSVTIPADRIQG